MQLCKCCGVNSTKKNVACEDCSYLMTKGILLIEIDPVLTKNIRKPFRTGEKYIVSDEWLEILLGHTDFLYKIKERGVTFFPNDLADKLGLPNNFDEMVVDVKHMGY